MKWELKCLKITRIAKNVSFLFANEIVDARISIESKNWRLIWPLRKKGKIDNEMRIKILENCEKCVFFICKSNFNWYLFK